MATPLRVPPKIPPKPRIHLQMPPTQPPMYGYNPNLLIPTGTGANSVHCNPLFIPHNSFNNFNNMQPMTPATGLPADAQYYNPFMNMYQSKASEFMFNKFEGFKDFTMSTARGGLSFGEKYAYWMYNKISKWSKKWFTHIFLFLVIMSFTAAGAAIFVAVEGRHETVLKTDIRQRKNEFFEELRLMSKNAALLEDPELWRGRAKINMDKFEEHMKQWLKQGATDDGKIVWSFWNAVFYCGTIYTTIGYGHIAPSTTTGRAITIVYAIFGIPLFLILLADFGKLFTRCIKFLWAFVRRLYYTGSCRKVRKTVQVQEVMKGLNMVYEAASTFRRPSQFDLDNPEGLEELPPKLPPKPNSPKPQTPSSGLLNVPPSFKRETAEDGVIDMDPQTPAPSVFEIDDEFNLPISVAITCLIIYIFLGASIYVVWEDWGFFESFYFVFISMSTIGFGDFVPNHPMYMMGSIIYLVFGMALTSMCINVVQVKLSDSFRQASAKIGATIGLRVSEEDGSLAPVTPVPVEVPAIHGGAKTLENKSGKPVAV